jgi:hypothetical protein
MLHQQQGEQMYCGEKPCSYPKILVSNTRQRLVVVHLKWVMPLGKQVI